MAIGKIADDSGSGLRLKMVRRACCVWSHQWHNMIMKPKEQYFVTSWFFGMAWGYRTKSIMTAVWSKNKNKKKIYRNVNFCRKTIDTSIWKGVCTNMLDIFLIIWLHMSNILTSLIPCFIERCQNGTFSARIQFWKYQIIFFLVFQMVYLVSIS